jgi:hypothetical protein
MNSSKTPNWRPHSFAAVTFLYIDNKNRRDRGVTLRADSVDVESFD